MKLERFAAVVVVMGDIVWDGINAHPLNTDKGRAAALVNAVKQYDPFQRVNQGKGREPISDEIRELISGANDQALDTLPI